MSNLGILVILIIIVFIQIEVMNSEYNNDNHDQINIYQTYHCGQLQYSMNQQLRNLLVVGGLLGASYFAYNYYIQDTLTLPFTRKVLQQIKHQMLIVTINFADGSKIGLTKLRQSGEEKADQLIQYFTAKMAQIYEQKQNLILGKYNISKDKFKSSLERYKNDSKIQQTQNQIIQMMQKSVAGEIPDLTIDKRATTSFTKDQIKKIYEDMSKMILISLVAKLQTQKRNNPNFDTNDDGDFKKAIKQLNIYDKKIDFFKSRGFKEEWGCPNQTFFKLSESLKLKDACFKEGMNKLQKTYEKIVDIAAKDPFSISIQKINDYYVNQALLKRDTVNQQQENEQEEKIQQVKQQNLTKSSAEPKRPKLGIDQLINMNRSTRSEPQHDDEIQPIPEVSNSAQKSDESEQLPRSKSVIQPATQQKQQQKLNVEDVPNDAKQLQKQTEAQLKQQQIQLEGKQDTVQKTPEISGQNQGQAHNNSQQGFKGQSNVSLNEEPIYGSEQNKKQQNNADNQNNQQHA